MLGVKKNKQYFVLVWISKNKSTHINKYESYLTLCDTRDCSPQGSSVRGIFQARILDWVAISLSSIC